MPAGTVQPSARNEMLTKLTCSFLGAFLVAVLLSVLRAFYYFYSGIEPNMSPMMFVIFSPIFGLVFGLLGVVIEFLINKFHSMPKSNWHAVLYGASYSAPLVFLIEPWLLLLVVIINPIVLRVLLRYRLEGSKTP
jgi:hypothetical protein